MIDWIIENKEWLFSGLGISIIGLFLTIFLRSRSANSQKLVIKKGNSNVQIGKVSINNYNTESKPGILDITSVIFTRNSEFDISLRNVGDDVCIINKISIENIEDHMMGVRPMLHPSAKYQIPVRGMKVGETKHRKIHHYINPRSADRILIGLNCTLVYTLKVTLHYNKTETVSFTKRMWTKLDEEQAPE